MICALGLTIGLASAVPTSRAQAVADDLQCAESLIQKTLKNGAAWRMCARIHPIKGLVLEKIEFKPASGDYEYAGYKRVLDQIYLAQLNVPYDTGNTYYNDIPSYGFGNQYLMPQVPELCLGDPIDVHQSYSYYGQLVERTIPGICTDEVPTGLSNHSQEAPTADGLNFIDHGTALEVSSLSKISWYEYQQKLTFDDHGTIDVALGATGDLAPGSPGSPYFGTNSATGWPLGPPIDGQNYYAASHWHNAIYRVDFGIDEGARQEVEQWDYTSPEFRQGPIVHGALTQKAIAFSSTPGRDHDELTWWRVLNPDSKNKDGHPRSYEIVNRNITDRFLQVTSPIVSFTNAHDCQEYASDNLNPGCPGQSVLDYVANDNAPLTDPVAWVNVGFHHIDRDEDQSPMPTHWQRFQLVPRDFFAQSPTITDARSCINGPPDGAANNTGSCIATNLVRPRVTADAAGIKPGTKLTATSGTWDTGGTQWSYAYLWFRDGEPIVNTDENDQPAPAVGPTYVVTAADRGTSITAKVTASQVGMVSGTAESEPVIVPGDPKPTPKPSATTPPKPKPVASTTKGKLVKSRITVKKKTRMRVTVKAHGVVPNGKFQVRHGHTVLRVGWLRNGRATVWLPKLKKARKYRLRVVYLGNAKVKASRSGLISLRVTKR